MAPLDDDDVMRLSQSAGIPVLKTDVQEYKDLLNNFIKTAEALYDIPDEKPNQDGPYYLRKPGKRPEPKDNPFNAWFVKGEVIGASSGILAGKRVAIKDNIAVAGLPMTMSSRLLEGYNPDYDATAVSRILRNGGTIAGKAACENLLSTGHSITCATGTVLNPIDKTRTSGGSSSGNAVLVATGEVDLSLGSDTAGSIRIPCSYCGVVGLKPTSGLVPLTGSMPIYPQFDVLGPMTKNVTDCATFLQALVDGNDDDGSPVNQQDIEGYTKELNKGVKGLKIGILKEGFDVCDARVSDVIKKTLKLLEAEGAELTEISVPEHKLAEAVFGIAITSGTVDILLKNGGIQIGVKGFMDAEAGARLQMGVRVSPEQLPIPFKLLGLLNSYFKEKDMLRSYAKAKNIIPKIRKAFVQAFSNCDVMVMPTVPTIAPKLPLATEVTGPKGIMKNALGATVNNISFNITGQPSMTVNGGWLDDMPVGLMISANDFQEALVFRVGRAVEIALGK
jgi:amidase